MLRNICESFLSFGRLLCFVLFPSVHRGQMVPLVPLLCHFASGTKDCFHFIVSPADKVFAGAILLPAIVGDTTVGMRVFL